MILKINLYVFSLLCGINGTPLMNLFSSCTNTQQPRYMSLYSDTSAQAINAFLHAWDEYVYTFPSSNLIPRVLKKLTEDADCYVEMKNSYMIPEAKKQTNNKPTINDTYTGEPFYLKASKILLRLLSDSQSIHQLHQKLRLVACTLSGIKQKR